MIPRQRSRVILDIFWRDSGNSGWGPAICDLINRGLSSSFKESCDAKDGRKSTLSAAQRQLHPVALEARQRSTTLHMSFDRMHLWHPYTSLSSPTPVLPIKFASGCRLTLECGRSLVDGMSSWWSAVHGYNHPTLNNALQEQMSNFSHVMFGGLTHRPAAELASLLLHVTPTNLTKVFFADSGSVAVEVALKMALQYQRGMGRAKKSKFATIRGGYHGDTFGAMSVCDPITGMHSAFADNLMKNLFVCRPPCDRETSLCADDENDYHDDVTKNCSGCTCRRGDGTFDHDEELERSCAEMEQTLERNSGDIAAFILEPIVQGAGGMRFYNRKYLQRARAACDAHEVLLIVDEIATAFGRAGGNAFFACDIAGVRPDIMCVGKALTGGYLTLGATLTTDEVATGVSSAPPTPEKTDGDQQQEKVALPLMHGPTFMGNPLACSAGVASLSLLLKRERGENDDDDDDDNKYEPGMGKYVWRRRVSAIEKQLRKELKPLSSLPNVADVRVRGAIGVVEMKNPLDVSSVTRRCKALGAWLRPFGRLLYTMPPYIITKEELSIVTNAMHVLAATSSSSKIV